MQNFGGQAMCIMGDVEMENDKEQSNLQEDTQGFHHHHHHLHLCLEDCSLLSSHQDSERKNSQVKIKHFMTKDVGNSLIFAIHFSSSSFC